MVRKSISNCLFVVSEAWVIKQDCLCPIDVKPYICMIKRINQNKLIHKLAINIETHAD